MEVEWATTGTFFKTTGGHRGGERRGEGKGREVETERLILWFVVLELLVTGCCGVVAALPFLKRV